MRPLLALVLLMPISGCVDWVDVPEPPSAECRQGDGLFVLAQHHPGFTSYEYQLMFYTLERDGRLTYFRAHDDRMQGSDPGTGRVEVRGRLHNLTAQDVEDEMKRVGAWDPTRDYNVSVAWRHTVSAARFEAFCAKVLHEFYGYRARYEDDRIADCDAFEFTIHTHRGTHTSYSYCRTGPDGVRDAFDQMRDEAWRRFGIEGL